MTHLNLPLTIDEDGDIYDYAGGEIASVWLHLPNGRFPRSQEDQLQSIAYRNAVGAEIVRRVNAHNALADRARALVQMHLASREGISQPTREEWIEAVDALSDALGAGEGR